MTYFEVGNAKLYCGDSREIIPGLAFDDVLTDPPYGIEDMVGGYGRGGRTIANDRNLDVCREVLDLCAKRMPAGYVAAFYSCRITDQFFEAVRGLGREDAPLTYFGEIVWDKKAPGMGNPIRYQHENVALFKVGEPASDFGATFSVVSDFRSADKHPHQKPLGIMGRLARVVGTGGVVLDPFMGSGSTGVACAQQGRRPFIGIELDPKHFETACERIATAHDQASTLAPPPTPLTSGETESMFA